MSPCASDVSVITVNWNGKVRLAELLPSLSALECKEVIVVDNGSEDGSIEFLRSRFPKTRLLQNAVNRGFAHPCNLGAKEAQGSVVAFINNDMRADRAWIDAALPHLAADTPCVASRILDWAGERIDFNGSSMQYLGYALQRDIGSLFAAVSHEDRALFPCGGAMLIDREAFLEAGGFDEDFFAIFEDVDLGWRLWLMGFQVAFAPDSIVFHRGHATFDTQPNEKMRYLMHRNALLTILKNYEEATFQRILPLAVAMAVKRAVLFSGASKESFYLWERTRSRLQLGDPAVQRQLLDSLNHLVAVDDVLGALPHLMEKRRRIQARRRRGDDEIAALFRDPFRAIVEDSEYADAEFRFLKCLQLDSIFGGLPQDKRLGELDEKLKSKTAELRRELTALQWIAGKASTTPPSHTGPGPQAFLKAWRKHGWRHAWRRFVERIEIGI